MDFQQLKIFLNVAALKSFSRAAERMYISQPSVSARIKALEEELGALLFDRSPPRELALTREGILFMDYAQKMLNLQKSLFKEMTGSRSLFSKQERIGKTGDELHYSLACRARFYYLLVQ